MFRVKPLLAVVLAFTVAGSILGTEARLAAQHVTLAATPEIGETAGNTVQPGGTLPGNPAIHLVKVAGGLADPVTVAAPRDGSGRLFVVERIGRIRIIDRDGTLLPEPFLDLTPTAAWTGVVATITEQGMLGLAFHPDYATNGRFYVALTDLLTNGDLFVVEFHVSPDDPNRAAKADDPYAWVWGGQLLLAVDQPYVDHNGGTLRFGPDGYLYIGLGDGGGGSGDPRDNAQDHLSLLGKLLRIDVDSSQEPYGIPPDNPFDDTGPLEGASGGEGQRASPYPELNQNPEGDPYDSLMRREIWAIGLRNPWQFSFDPKTGDLYIPDVGDLTWEEINFQLAGSPGGQNYGWDRMEGAHCFPEDRTECPVLGTLPVAEYKHGRDGCAVVGIGVYRGEEFPSLDGTYFSADHCTGKIWGLRQDQDGSWVYQELLDTDLVVAGSGSDEAGNLYVTSCVCSVEPYFDPAADPQGAVWRLVAGDQVPAGAATAPLGS